MCGVATCCVCLQLCANEAAGQSDGARKRETFPTAMLSEGRYLSALTEGLSAPVGY